MTFPNFPNVYGAPIYGTQLIYVLLGLCGLAAVVFGIMAIIHSNQGSKLNGALLVAGGVALTAVDLVILITVAVLGDAKPTSIPDDAAIANLLRLSDILRWSNTAMFVVLVGWIVLVTYCFKLGTKDPIYNVVATIMAALVALGLAGNMYTHGQIQASYNWAGFNTPLAPALAYWFVGLLPVVMVVMVVRSLFRAMRRMSAMES